MARTVCIRRPAAAGDDPRRGKSAATPSTALRRKMAGISGPPERPPRSTLVIVAAIARLLRMFPALDLARDLALDFLSLSLSLF